MTLIEWVFWRLGVQDYVYADDDPGGVSYMNDAMFICMMWGVGGVDFGYMDKKMICFLVFVILYIEMPENVVI